MDQSHLLKLRQKKQELTMLLRRGGAELVSKIYDTTPKLLAQRHTAGRLGWLFSKVLISLSKTTLACGTASSPTNCALPVWELTRAPSCFDAACTSSSSSRFTSTT